MKKVFLLLLTLVLLSLNTAKANGTVTGVFNITRIGLNVSSGIMFITVDKDVGSHNTCPNVRTEFLWSLDQPGVKEIYSTALLAHSQGKPIYVGVPAGNKCVLNQPTGDWLYLRP